MSEDEQERKSGAADDFMSTNTQSQVYTATEDTLFTKTTSTLSRTHSLVSMSHSYIPSKIENELVISVCFCMKCKSQLGSKQMRNALTWLHILLLLKSFRDQSGFHSKQHTLLQL